MSKKKTRKAKAIPETKTKEKKKPIPFKTNFTLDNRYLLVSAIIAIALAFAQYFQTLPYEFVLDDQIVVSENTFVKKGVSGIGNLLFSESMVGYFGEQKDLIPGARYRPLSLITFAIEYEIFGGLNSKMNHLFNILYYGLCGILLFVFLGKILSSNKKLWLSVPLLIGFVWMVHPVHSEAVANIKGRDEIISLIFALICMLLSLSIMEKQRFLVLKFIGLFICFFLGLLSKENNITLLAIIPATLYFFREANPKKMLAIFSTLMVSFIGYILIRYSAVGYLLIDQEVTDIMNNPFLGMGFMERMATIFYVLLKYIGLSFVPYPLTHDYYPFQIPRVGWGNIFVLLSVVVHFALAIYAIMKFKSRNIWAYIIFFYIASLSIYSNIVINVGTTMNERFLFVPTIATCMALVLGLTQIIKKFKLPGFVVPSILGLISIIFFIITFNRAQVWENALTLNTAAVKISTNSARANSFMATALFEEAKTIRDRAEKTRVLQEANIYVKKSYDLLPTYTNVNIMKAGIAAELYKMDNNLDALLNTFTEIAPYKPSLSFMHEYIEYLDGRNDPRMMEFFYNVGYNVLSTQHNEHSWGLKFLNYGLIKEPNNAKINWAISQVYARAGNMNQSQLFRNKAIQLDPSYMNK